MPRRKDGPGPGRAAHLADLLRTGRPPSRWPAGSDRCPQCGELAAFGIGTSPGSSSSRYAIFDCSSCDASWRSDRLTDKRKSSYTKTEAQKKSNREAQARRRQAARENAA